ncbi:MAG: energy transducer TonB [Verrucomicrobiota bacterium]
MNYDVSKETLIKVTLIHLTVIGIFLIPFGGIFFKREKVKYIEMVALGTANPAKGTPAPPQAANSRNGSQKSPPAQPAPPAPKVETPPKEETPASSPPEIVPRATSKSEPKPWEKSSPKIETKTETKKTEAKQKSEVKISTKIVTRGKSTDASSVKTSDKPWKKTVAAGHQGPTAAEIKAGLEAGVQKGLQTVGVSTGSENGVGIPGKPGGQDSWYHTLIRETFLKNWQKPQLPGAARLETLVAIRIARDGSVTFLKISQPSGNDTMDATVMQAVRSVHKLSQPLPSNLGNPDYEVVINFRLD